MAIKFDIEKMRLTPDQQKLAEEYINMTYYLVGEWARKYKGSGFDAVYDAAITALIYSARNWDESKGTEFKTYLYYSTHTQMIKITRDANAKKRQGQVSSFDEPLLDDEGSLHDIIGEEDHYRFFDQEFIKDAAETLTDRERKLIYLNIVEGVSQKEIAKDVGMSQMHVSRVVRKGLAKMRDYAEKAI